jgi:hypothetical protein
MIARVTYVQGQARGRRGGRATVRRLLMSAAEQEAGFIGAPLLTREDGRAPSAE